MIDNELVPYITVGGERWDNLANIAYGNPSLSGPIISCNPSVPIRGRIPGGITIYFPVLSQDSSPQLPNETLPLWKQ